MRSGAKRGAAAAGTVGLAAAVNVATGMLTQRWAVAWWVATIVLVVIGAVVQVWLTVADRHAPVGGADAETPVGGGPAGVEMRARASGHGRVYMAGGDQTINER